MRKFKKTGLSMILASLMLLVMAVPAFAESVNVEIFKSNSDEYSMAQNAVKSAELDTKEDGNTDLVITTQWFKHMGLWGTMAQLKYSGIESNENYPPKHAEGTIRVGLTQDYLNQLNANGEVFLSDSYVKSTVHFIGAHTGDYKNVRIKLSK